jgi:hypothetical protein
MDITLHGHDTYTPIISGWGIEEDESSSTPDLVAQLATGRDQPPTQGDEYSRIRNDPSWHNLLDISHDEHHDIRNYSDGRSPSEQNVYDPIYAYLGISNIQPEMFNLVQSAYNLVAEMEPSTYAESQRRWDKAEWLEAITMEKGTLQQMNCYDVVQLPRGAKAIKSRLVFKLKLGRDGLPTKRKVRIVGKGFQQ